eukprot:245839-Prymnesium_polylepis.2
MPPRGGEELRSAGWGRGGGWRRLAAVGGVCAACAGPIGEGRARARFGPPGACAHLVDLGVELERLALGGLGARVEERVLPVARRVA